MHGVRMAARRLVYRRRLLREGERRQKRRRLEAVRDAGVTRTGAGAVEEARRVGRGAVGWREVAVGPMGWGLCRDAVEVEGVELCGEHVGEERDALSLDRRGDGVAVAFGILAFVVVVTPVSS